MRAWRDMDVPAVAGFVASSAGFTALVVELAVRGWWGFATSGWELLIIQAWLGGSGWLSWRAYTGTYGWWKALAALGIGLAMVGILWVVAICILWLLVNRPNLVIGKSTQMGNRRGRRRW